MKKYAVIGNPIAHSLSPIIHQLFAEQVGIDLEYSAIALEEAHFEVQLLSLLHDELQGVNITSPFKKRCLGVVDVVLKNAQSAQSVNTIWKENNQLIADSTDGVGFHLDLQRLNIALENKKVLILGAGGAVSAILSVLFKNHVAQVDILNRTLEKSHELVRHFLYLGLMHAVPFSTPLKTEYDVILNSVPVCLLSQYVNITHCVDFFHQDTVCYDLCYSLTETLFQQWVKNHNIVNHFNGLGMLIYQAAESFRLWHHQSVNVIPVFQYFDKKRIN